MSESNYILSDRTHCMCLTSEAIKEWNSMKVQSTVTQVSCYLRDKNYNAHAAKQGDQLEEKLDEQPAQF